MPKTVQIRSLDHTGDSVLAEFDPQQQDAVKVAQDKLTAFLSDCVSKHGGESPPVWAKRSGEDKYKPIDPKNSDDIAQAEEILVHQRVVGG